MNCIFYRWRAVRTLDSGVRPSARLCAHLAVCSGCRAGYEHAQTVVAQLRRAALAMPLENPGALRTRIMANVRAGDLPKTAARPVFDAIWLGAAAAVALAVGAGLWRARTPAIPGQSPVAMPVPAALSDLADTVRPLAASWDSWSVAPLEAESMAVRADLADAGRHLFACLEP